MQQALLARTAAGIVPLLLLCAGAHSNEHRATFKSGVPHRIISSCVFPVSVARGRAGAGRVQLIKHATLRAHVVIELCIVLLAGCLRHGRLRRTAAVGGCRCQPQFSTWFDQRSFL